MITIFKTHYQVAKNITLLGILITGLLSAIIGVIAFFGQNMGTFVISADGDSYTNGIILSETEDFSVSSPRLLVDPIHDSSPITYANIKIEEAKATDGNYYDSDNFTYIAYTFYVANNGETIVDVEYKMNFTEITKGIDGAIRIMLIVDDEDETIYMKEDANGISPFDDTPLDEVENFNSELNVCTKEFTNFRPDNIKKFTMIVWLEGNDADCTDEIQGGNMKMEMLFNITSAKASDGE
ncbi:MAG: hypothetical protein WCR33_03320 [Bacilli bacterium]